MGSESAATVDPTDTDPIPLIVMRKYRLHARMDGDSVQRYAGISDAACERVFVRYGLGYFGIAANHRLEFSLVRQLFERSEHICIFAFTYE